jgi:metallo-beta-lactamase family protein
MKPSIDSRTTATLLFLGAAGTVTGSKFLVTAGDSPMLVDCGLFQGPKEQRVRNWDRLPMDASAIKSVALTHAHLDHSGYLPALCRNGFQGRVFCTADTHSLCRILLPDSGHLQEEEADYANRRGYSKHAPALPLYTEREAWKSLEHFSPVPFDSTRETDYWRVTFPRAGHILGSSMVLLETSAGRGRRILFSGDLGRPRHPILRAPQSPPRTDVIVVESTYGDRRHDDAGSLELFAQAVSKTAARGGVIVIPSFAVDRTEVVLFHLRRLQLEERIPDLPVYVDSPMALAALKLYQRAISQGDSSIRSEIVGRPELLEPAHLVEIRTVEESIALNNQHEPMIIIAASGMATGGRVLHHLAHRLPDRRNTVILVGYQAAGTRGRSLLEGAPSVKMLGRYVPARAEVVNLPAFSVHADQAEILDWLKSAAAEPEVVYIVHGEPAAAEQLRSTIVRELGWNAVAPRHLERVRLD